MTAEAVAGVLADGTPFYAPIGEVVVDGSLVTCHLCGRALRSVTAHLRAHGWTKERVLRGVRPGTGPVPGRTGDPQAPGGRPGCPAGLRARGPRGQCRGAGPGPRRGPDPRRGRGGQRPPPPGTAPQEGPAGAGRDPARRRCPGQPGTCAPPSRRGRRRRRPCATDTRISERFVLTRVADGASLAAISREAGLHKDWLSRHLGEHRPGGGRSRAAAAADRWDARWRPALRPARLPRRAQLLARTPHGAASDCQLDRRRGRPDPSRRRVRAAPSRAGPGGSRRQAP